MTYTEVFDTASVTNWTPPRGCYSVTIECWGAGGGGGTPSGDGGGGGGGGAYARVSNYQVVPGTTYVITVGEGGLEEINGGDSSFDSICIALGGSCGVGATGGSGGSGDGSTGDVTYSGGNGANGGVPFTNDGGGGGGGAGSGGSGSSGSGTNGGAGGSPDGGAGGDGDSYPIFGGSAGTPPGGGGGGGEVDSFGSYQGADGKVVLTYELRYLKGSYSYKTGVTMI